MVGSVVAHWFSGSWPAGTAVQMPVVVASAHDWQLPLQALLQQTPCWQYPGVSHSMPELHFMPTVFFVQIVPMQKYPVEQSVSAAHFVRQVPDGPQA
jgi:hypothetical protein